MAIAKVFDMKKNMKKNYIDSFITPSILQTSNTLERKMMEHGF